MHSSLLVCKVRERFVALPLLHVVETMRPLPVESLAGTPSFIRGLSLVRGQPTPVVDAGLLLGEATTAAATGRFVSVRTEGPADAQARAGRSLALAVDEVRGVHRVAPDEFETLSPLLGPESAALVANVGKLDAALLLVLRTLRIVPEATWALIDAWSVR